MLSSTMISPNEENNGSGRNPIERQGKRQCQSSRHTIRNEKSMFRGVTRDRGGLFRAFVWDVTEPIKQGAFDKEEEAARAHDLADKEEEAARAHDLADKEEEAARAHGLADKEEEAARAHDLAALKLWGKSAVLQFPIEQYQNDLEEMHIKRDNTEQKRTGKTGGFESEVEAARAFDLATLKLWGQYAAPNLNFPPEAYEKDLEEMKNMTMKDYLLLLRRKSDGFSKGVSTYRGVSRSPNSTKWQAKIGKSSVSKSLYLGTFDTEEEAARAYDVVQTRMKGEKAFTNFDRSQYDVKSIFESPMIPIGKGASRILRELSAVDVLESIRKTTKEKTPMVQPSPSPPTVPQN